MVEHHLIHKGLLITSVTKRLSIFEDQERVLTYCFAAPEYALDEVLDPASDVYSLGCLIYAVHCKGNTPFKNHGSLSSVRENAGKPLPGLNRLDEDLRGDYVCFLHQV